MVRVPTKEGKTTLLRHPLKCLYPLECNIGDSEEQASGRNVMRQLIKDVINELDPQLQPGTRRA